MEQDGIRKEPPILLVIAGLFLALLMGDLFKVWLSPNLSFALGYVFAVLFLGAFRQKFQLSWARLVFWAFGIGLFAFIFRLLQSKS